MIVIERVQKMQRCATRAAGVIGRTDMLTYGVKDDIAVRVVYIVG